MYANTRHTSNITFYGTIYSFNRIRRGFNHTHLTTLLYYAIYHNVDYILFNLRSFLGCGGCITIDTCIATTGGVATAGRRLGCVRRRHPAGTVDSFL